MQGLKSGRSPASGADAVLKCQAHHPVGCRLEEPATSPGCSVAKHDHKLPRLVLHVQPSAACLHLQQQLDASVSDDMCRHHIVYHPTACDKVAAWAQCHLSSGLGVVGRLEQRAWSLDPLSGFS